MYVKEAEVWNVEENGLHSYHGTLEGYEQKLFPLLRVLDLSKYSGEANL
jgi:hypothetical protein